MGEIEKLAQTISLGDPVSVGREMAGIIGFILRSVPPDGRVQALQNLKGKLSALSPGDIAGKQSPPTAAVGQAITFVKTILNGLPYNYVKTVLDTTLRTLH